MIPHWASDPWGSSRCIYCLNWELRIPHVGHWVKINWAGKTKKKGSRKGKLLIKFVVGGNDLPEMSCHGSRLNSTGQDFHWQGFVLVMESVAVTFLYCLARQEELLVVLCQCWKQNVMEKVLKSAMSHCNVQSQHIHFCATRYCHSIRTRQTHVLKSRKRKVKDFVSIFLHVLFCFLRYKCRVSFYIARSCQFPIHSSSWK